MKKIILTLGIVTAILTTGYSSEQNTRHSLGSYQSSSEFINSLDPRRMLFSVCMKTATHTTTWGMIVGKVGKDKAKRMLTEELIVNGDSHLPEWIKNMEDSYLSVFTEDELSSLKNVKKSDLSNDMKKKMQMAWMKLGRNSNAFVKKITTKSLKNVYTQVQ